MELLDDPSRITELRRRIQKKNSLRLLYEEVYQKYVECLSRCPGRGLALELGSGAGFVKKIIPEILTSDLLPYQGMDCVIDGIRLPFPDQSLRFICMTNVFHHIPDAESFFSEALRCLVPGGRIMLVDQHPGYISRPIFKRIHHEPFNPDALQWKFESTGPLSAANGALAWMVFVRDLKRFETLFPQLTLVRYSPHTPLRYWMSGGLKRWNLLPGWAFGIATSADRALIRLCPELGSFVDIEIVKQGEDKPRP